MPGKQASLALAEAEQDKGRDLGSTSFPSQPEGPSAQGRSPLLSLVLRTPPRCCPARRAELPHGPPVHTASELFHDLQVGAPVPASSFNSQDTKAIGKETSTRPQARKFKVSLQTCLACLPSAAYLPGRGGWAPGARRPPSVAVPCGRPRRGSFPCTQLAAGRRQGRELCVQSSRRGLGRCGPASEHVGSGTIPGSSVPAQGPAVGQGVACTLFSASTSLPVTKQGHRLAAAHSCAQESRCLRPSEQT